MGLLYFIQPTEYVGTTTYKIGCSRTPTIQRFKSYGKKTEYIIIMECNNNNLFVIEGELRKVFEDKFELHRGREYFIGDKEKMKEVFNEIVNNEEVKELMKMDDEDADEDAEEDEKYSIRNKKLNKQARKAIPTDRLENYMVEIMNQYMFIPDDKLENYKELVIDQNNLIKHLNICRFFFNLTENPITDLAKQIKKKFKGFPINDIATNMSKLKFLFTILEATNAVKYNPQNPLHQATADEMVKRCDSVFQNRKKKPYDFTTMNSITVFLAQAYRYLFGGKILKQTRHRIKGNDYYEFEVNTEELQFHETLFDYRQAQEIEELPKKSIKC